MKKNGSFRLQLIFVMCLLIGGLGFGLCPAQARWSVMETGVSWGLNGIWGASSEEVFAVGENGVVLYYDGTQWEVMETDTVFDLYAVWGRSASDVYAIGKNGYMLHYDGTSWTEVWSASMPSPVPSGEYLYAIWGSPTGTDIYAVGSTWSSAPNSYPTIIFFDGTRWVLVYPTKYNEETPSNPLPQTSDYHLATIWGLSTTDFYVAGGGGLIWHYAGGIDGNYYWEDLDSGIDQEIQDIWGSAADNILFLGSDTIFQYDGSSFSPLTTGPMTGLNALWGASADDVFAVGMGGEIVHYNGNSQNVWEEMSSKTYSGLMDIWGTSGTDVYAAGESGTIIHYAPGITPTAAFTVSPTIGDTSTSFSVDASGCSDVEDSVDDLGVRWDWETDGTWDTSFSTQKSTAHTYSSTGNYTITMQVRDTDLLTDSTTQAVTVKVLEPPNAAFSVTPSTGDTYTRFIADALASSDPEDPVENLQVRWDWETDGSWDTDFSTVKLATHQYDQKNIYLISLEVKDTHGELALASKYLTVTAAAPTEATQPTAAFTVVPSTGDTNTVFTVDASESSDSKDGLADLRVRWDWETDGSWDTDFTTTKSASFTYSSPGTHTITLEVKDTDEESRTTSAEVTVTGALPEADNSKPVASFTVTADSATEFSVDASGSYDAEDSTDALMVRWDWQTDGGWDTDYAFDKTASHDYSAEGYYYISLEVMDSGGLTDTTQKRIVVSAGQIVDCEVDLDCDDRIYCNGRESCDDGGCVSGQAPCTGSETCLEETETCREQTTIPATTFPLTLRKPLVLDPAPRILTLLCESRTSYSPLISTVTLEGPTDNATGVALHPALSPWKAGRLIFVPVLLSRSASAGVWTITIETPGITEDSMYELVVSYFEAK